MQATQAPATGPDFYNAPAKPHSAFDSGTMMNPGGGPEHPALVAQAAQILEAAKDRFMAAPPPVPRALGGPGEAPMQASTRAVLSEFPAKIRQARRKLWDARTQQDHVALELKLLEARIGLTVAEEATADGKKRYTNAESRADATRAYAMEDAGCRDLRGRLDAVRLLIENIDATMECWRLQFRAAETMETADALAERRPAAFITLAEE